MSARMISSNIYSSSGNLIKTRYLTAVINTPTPTGTKTHIANFTFGSNSNAADTLTRVDFPGGYFDAKGGVHWMLTDAIGSIEMVVDSRGSVEQHTGYYPYGEPWRNPAGQPYLFGAKERRSYASLNDYDFHARFYTAANTLWHAPDSHAGKYHHLSPWTFCAANPIRYSDPTGMIIENPEEILKAYKEHVNSRIKELIEANKKNGKVVEYYKGWKEDLEK